ncbi:hypothetical protein [Paenibacillus mendelii]|uniref:ABC transporter substrate-binding protein n=1 Tax=Paenibacillus mendelii TaxID=206163 RepID=A0ABV6J971_9BACL|nr:hypothetical protein [Paenibacillus mendelii]MCQ6559756.1 hypothetical protein [Paenibacillus mendelii]
MKKSYLVVVALLLSITLVLSGCGSSKEEKSENTGGNVGSKPEAAVKDVKLSLRHTQIKETS